MLIDAGYAFTSLNGGSTASEDIATSGSTENLSVALEMEAADVGDGHRDLYLVITCKDNTDAADGVFLFKLTDSTAVGGTYYQCLGKQVPVASVTDGALLYKAKLPEDCKKFLKLSVTGVGTTSGKIIVVNAALVTG